uniref:Urine glycopeptide n=1 Tax=Homo sapiens TaxID=9606 RepID=GLUR_HUMAN|nr:RecName: Full=Urine glycopeptide [Homo sapiens]prf//711659A protein,glyco [Homo sapiens]
CEHSHDGA